MDPTASPLIFPEGRWTIFDSALWPPCLFENRENLLNPLLGAFGEISRFTEVISDGWESW